MNDKMIAMLFVMAILLAVLLYAFAIRKDSYQTVSLKTLGKFGYVEPPSCYEEEPSVRFKDLYICNACNLGCSSKKSWEQCKKCQYNLGSTIPGVM